VRVKAAYRQFLAYPLPRVFVLSKSGVFAVYHGFDPLGSTMRRCRQTSARCAVYAYDNDVVWTGLPAASDLAPAAAQGALYSMPVHPNATTRLAFFFSLRADCSVRGLAIVTVTRRPAHGVAAVAQIDDFVKPEAGSAFAACGTARVPGVALTYTPAPGFTGTDTLAVDSLEAGDQERSMQVNLVVK